MYCPLTTYRVTSLVYTHTLFKAKRKLKEIETKYLSLNKYPLCDQIIY